MIFERIFVDVGFAEVVGELRLHLLGGVEGLDGFGAQFVDAELPGLRDVLAEVLCLCLTDNPAERLALAFVEACEGADGGRELQLADIAAGRLLVGIAEGEAGVAAAAFESEVAYG